MNVRAIADLRCGDAVTERRGGIRTLLSRWYRRAGTRAALRELPPRMLHDVGLTPLDAAREAARPFWKA